MNKLHLYISSKMFYDDPVPAEPADAPIPAIEGFTPEQQEKINKLVAATRNEATSKTQKIIEELETYKQKANLTGQSAKDLEAQIEKIRNESLTKEELLKKEQAKKESKFKTDIDELSKERDTWKTRYTTQTINTQLQHAAIKHNAFNATQIVDLLSNRSKIEPEIDKDGNTTDNLVVKVSIKTKDSTGKEVILSTSPEEAVKVLSETDEYANLFTDKVAGGLQRNKVDSSAAVDPSKLIRNDIAAYMEGRKKGTIKLPE